MSNQDLTIEDNPYNAELDKYSIEDLIGALSRGEIEGVPAMPVEYAILYIVSNKEPIGLYEIPFADGSHTIFLYDRQEAILSSDFGPGRPGRSQGFRHVHEFITSNPALSEEPEFQRLVRETGFSTWPEILH